MFEKAKLIWINDSPSPDEFAEFYEEFEYTAGAACLYITAGSDYNAYLNGELVSFGQYPDYPAHRFYDVIPLNKVKIGTNRLEIHVWYYGVDSQTYVKSDAYTAFEVRVGSIPIVSSDEKTKSRRLTGYIPHMCRNITYQLGLAWRYDATRTPYAYGLSYAIEENAFDLKRRPIKRTVLEERVEGKLISKGKYTVHDDTLSGSRYMQESRFISDGSDGSYYIFDLGSEQVGFPEFSFSSDKEYEILIGWGEHLNDGKCRTAIRDFCLEYRCKKGENRFLGSFRRIGCRYVQFFIKGGDISDLSFGIRPVNYPINILPTNLTGIRKKIYDTSLHTLRCCMHDHYEDCPWREQALYTLDSRNQMLCGYYAFGEFEFARASLVLMSYGIRRDGLMNLCFPAGVDYPIPCYSLAYFLQVDEYLKYSNDKNTVQALLPTLEALMKRFTDKIGDDGLIDGFEGFWNFYEWSEGMSGNMKDSGKAKEAPLNAFLVLALQAFINIKNTFYLPCDDLILYCNTVKKSIGTHFYNKKSKLFESYSDRDFGKYSVLTNSLCLLCGAADGYDRENILKILSHNSSAGLDFAVIPNTLAMNSFRFDALLREDKIKYAPIILAEIDRVYSYMLDRGATTFWETIKGADDFRGAGSLCHGWSALPIYYYSILL